MPITIHKKISSHALIIALLSALFTTMAFGGSDEARDILTPDERLWLTNNQSRLVLAVETGYAPFVFLDTKGQPTGLANDYIRLIETKIGVSFRQMQFSSLNTIFEKVRAGDVHIVNAVTQTAERLQFLTFTSPFISVPNVILVRKDRAGQMNEKSLSGLKISLVKSYAVTEDLRNKNLGFSPDLVADDITALLNVSFGQSDAAVIDLATASYLISEKSITNLRVAGETEFSIRLAIATSINEPILKDILQKGLSAITDEEREEIRHKWISVSGQSILSDWRLWLAVGVVLVAILVTMVVMSIWNHMLQRQVKARTAELEAERAHLEQRVLERTADLARSEAQLRATLDNTPNVAVQWYDEADRVTYWNSASEKLFGWKAEEAVGKTFADLILTPEALTEYRRIFALIRENGNPYGPIETEMQTRNGNKVWMLSTTFSIPMANGQIGFVCMDVDITERKHLEAELIRYKDHLEEEVLQRTADLVLARDAAEAANKAKSIFLANMSHELRTPLNAILGFSSMMKKNSRLEQAVRDNIDVINRSGEHLLSLINDVLEVAKIEAGRVQIDNSLFDLGGLLRDVGDMMHVRAKQKGLKLQIDQSSHFPRFIIGDEGHLRQILINLVGNALKFTEQGAVILRLRTKQSAAAHLLIEVEDSGAGISAEDQQRIFEPFVQLGEHAVNLGTGLGLTITRQFVQMMGGTITLESVIGKGSLFRVDLPFQEASETDILRKSVEQAQAEVIGLAPGEPSYRILIVEDQWENQLLLTKLLEDIGFNVKVAENGEQGVQLFQGWHPDLILMDRRMPVMDGMQATQIIRSLPGGKEVKIVAVTASAFMEQRQEMLNAGMDDFVRKPYRFNEIYECLTRQLGVQYTYAEAQLVEDMESELLTSERLTVLPHELRNELREALEILDTERINNIIQQVAIYDASLQRRLAQLADRFDYLPILNALRTAPSDNET